MIAFVRPSAPLNRYIQNVPLNYIHLAGYLRERGYSPLILDEIFDEMTPDFVDRTIRERGIEVVGIGAMTCELLPSRGRGEAAEGGASETQNRILEVHIRRGIPRSRLRTGVVDYVIVGEGEIALGDGC